MNGMAEIEMVAVGNSIEIDIPDWLVEIVLVLFADQFFGDVAVLV